MPKQFRGKRKVHVVYWIERYDENSWYCPKLNKWGDGNDFQGYGYGNVCRRYTKKSATRMMMGLPKGSRLTKVFWKHGQRFMIDYYRS